MSAPEEAKRRGVGLRVVRLDEKLRYLLNLTRIDSVISIAGSLRERIVEESLRV